MNKTMNTSGFFSFVNEIKHKENDNFIIIPFEKWQAFKRLLLSNDELLTEFINMLFSYHIHAVYIQALNMMADNDIITSAEAIYNNDGRYTLH